MKAFLNCDKAKKSMGQKNTKKKNKKKKKARVF